MAAMGPLTRDPMQLPLASRVCVRNTFLDFEDDDDDEAPWIIGDARRLQTDSIIMRSSHSLLLSQQQNSTAGLPDRFSGLSLLPRRVEGSDAPSLLSPLSGVSPAPPMPPVGPARPPPPPMTLPGTDLASMARMKAMQAFTEESLQSPFDAGEEPDEEEEEEEEPEPAPTVDSDVQVNHSFFQDNYDGNSPFSSEMEKFTTRMPVSEELIHARDLALNGGGLSGYTTVMVRHIPGKYTQQKLMREINSAGFLGKYDFFYLPMQMQSRGNRSFAFVNFVSPEAAEAFYHTFHGRRLRHFRAGQAVTVAPADVQGFEQNAMHYATMRRTGNRRPLHTGHALFFKPLPPHLLDDEGQSPEAMAPWGSAAAPGRWDLPSQAPPRAGPPVGAVQAMSLPQRFCTQCGQPKPAEHTFCAFCGARGLPCPPAF